MTAPARDDSLDILRGLAIVLMIEANFAASFLAGPHPFLLRLLGSAAAPLFIFLSGMMVPLTAKSKGRGLSYFLRRGTGLMACAALIDLLIWRLLPFVGWDVLYLIGLSLPVAYLCIRLPARARWTAAALIGLVVPPVFHSIFGYSAEPVEYPLREGLRHFSPGPPLRQWAIDGWFPFFPWFGAALAGTCFQLRRFETGSSVPRGTLAAGFGLAAAGILVWILYPGAQHVRGGYSELFYPPVPGFMLTAAGAVLLLFTAAARMHRFAARTPLALLGRHSLFVYVSHTVLIQAFHALGVGFLPAGRFAALYACATALLCLAVAARRRLTAGAR